VIKVRLFAVAKQLAGSETIELNLPVGATIADARRALSERVPALAPLMPNLMFALRCNYAADSARIEAGDELACIPPVSGG